MSGLTATRADVLGAVAIIALSAAVVFGPRLCSRLAPHPSLAACEEMLARYVELKERSVTEKLDPKSYAAALEEAHRLAGPKLTACTTEVTLSEAECTRGAHHVDEFERCLQ